MIPETLLNGTYVTVPLLRIEATDDRVTVANDILGTRCECAVDMLRLLDLFRTPQTLREALASANRPDTVAMALRNAFIFDIDLLLSPAIRPVGRQMKLSDLLRSKQPPQHAVFGAGVDSAAGGRGGARHGPREIRSASPRFAFEAEQEQPDLEVSWVPSSAWDQGPPEKPVLLDFDSRRVYKDLPEVADLGDVRLLPGESINTFGARIGLVASLVINRGTIPGLLGGDHSVTSFALDAITSKYHQFGIMHFDAHHDLWQPFAPNMRYVTHANPFARVLEGSSLKQLYQLGLRIFEPIAPGKLRADTRVTYRSARELAQIAPDAAFASIPKTLPYYLTFDIDCIDPQYAPETGTPQQGGLTAYQATDLVAYAVRHFDIVGWDIVEVGRSEKAYNSAAKIAGQLVKELLLARTPFDELSMYCRVP